MGFGVAFYISYARHSRRVLDGCVSGSSYGP